MGGDAEDVAGALRAQADALEAQAETLRTLAEAFTDRSQRPVADLTVADLAEDLGKSESTIRSWLPIPGAYKLGAEWRIPREAWRAYLDRLAEQGSEEPPGIRSKPSADLGAWRKLGVRDGAC